MSSEPPERRSTGSARAPRERPGPPGGKRDRNRRQRTEALLEAALRLFLEHGIEPVTVDEIASEAGMAKGNFYRYFQHKAELVGALVEPLATRMRQAMRRCGDALAGAETEGELSVAYETLAQSMAEATLAHPDLVRLYLQERRMPGGRGERAPIWELAEEMRAGAVRLTEVAVEHRLLRVSDPRISAYAVVGAAEELALAVMQARLDAPPDRIAGTLISLVLDGIRERAEPSG